MSPDEVPAGETGQGQNSFTQTEIDIILCTRRAVDKTISTLCGFRLTEKPQISKKPVIEYMKKARIIKPVDCAFVSVMPFRNPQVRRMKWEVQGLMVLYIPEDSATTIARSFGIKGELSDDDIKDACGEFLNVTAGGVKTELVKAGYDELEISTPFNFGFKVDELFDYNRPYMFEIIFYLDGQKFIHIDIGLDTITKGGHS